MGCTDGRLLVKPSDPEHSYVVDKITNHDVCSGYWMPNGGQLLSDANIQTIYDWICEGAPNN